MQYEELDQITKLKQGLLELQNDHAIEQQESRKTIQ